jgi:hypothetical protein
MAPPTTVEEYLAALPEGPPRRRAPAPRHDPCRRPGGDRDDRLQHAAFRSHGGQFLGLVRCFKSHYSLFPASGAVVEALGGELAPYLAGKGTIRFPASEPLPLSIVARVVKIRLAENAEHDRR